MVKNLQRNGNEWTWRNGENSQGVYYTDKNGQGIFFQYDKNGKTEQLLGTCQFQACETASGMRRKLNKLYDEFIDEEPARYIRKKF